MNDKYLGPYIDTNIGKIKCFRQFLGTNQIFSGAIIFSETIENTITWGHMHSPEIFYSKKDAIRALDEYLINLGYQFLTQEQFEKLNLLI